MRIGDSAGGVYGTLLTMSVLVGLSVTNSGPGVMALTVTISVVVFWIAHVHAGLVAQWVGAEARPRRRARRDGLGLNAQSRTTRLFRNLRSSAWNPAPPAWGCAAKASARSAANTAAMKTTLTAA